ncbi:MAG: glycosyltransferase [Planctomycetaceae bacterium]|nr:glycosyltransferase [Planctomycetaceae bacterium]
MGFTLTFVVGLLLPSYAIVCYYLFFIVVRSFGVQEVRLPTQSPQHRFMIVIPAHNEQLVIERTIRSCQAANYPPEQFDITVIADNCNDATALIAKNLGTHVLTRDDPTHQGKGYALAWAFQRLLAYPHDAFMVLDADSPLDNDALAILDSFLQTGAKILQANHRSSNPDASPISYAASVGRTLEYDLFFAPKSKLGLSVMLVGTGMVFHRSILATHGWSSHSCAEDTEFTIQLTRQNQRIHFVGNAFVQFINAETTKELRVQRTRWASGILSLSRANSWKLIGEGIARRNLRIADLGWTLLVTSRPLVLIHLLAVQLGAAFLVWWIPSDRSVQIAYAALGLLPLYTLYLLAGIGMLGMSPRRFQHLLHTPLVLGKLASISLIALCGFQNHSWNRTPRH